MNPFVVVERDVLETLVDATQDAYARHMQELGTTTPKNKRWAEEMEQALREARRVLEEG